MMQYIFDLLRGLHILSGSLALLSGLLAIGSLKGAYLHRFSGRVFFWSMCLLSFTALLMAYIHANAFLAMLGVFAFYQNFGGYRVVRKKTVKPGPADYMVLLAASVNTVLMAMSLVPVLMVFAALSAALITAEIRTIICIKRGSQPDRLLYLRRHIGMMTGAYISALTAFLVNIRPLGSPVWVWLMPTLVLVPLIFIWNRRYS